MLTILALMVFKFLQGHEGSAAGKELMGELGFVVRLVGLLVIVTSLVYVREQCQLRFMKVELQLRQWLLDGNIPKPNIVTDL